MKRIRLFMAACAVFIGMGGMVPAVAMADSAQSTVCTTLGSNSSCTSTPHGSVSLSKVVTAIINIFSVIIGVTAVIMIMVGGFRYITSGGDSSNITSAKNTVVYAIIGLVIVAMAQFIVKFVLDKLK